MRRGVASFRDATASARSLEALARSLKRRRARPGRASFFRETFSVKVSFSLTHAPRSRPNWRRRVTTGGVAFHPGADPAVRPGAFFETGKPTLEQDEIWSRKRALPLDLIRGLRPSAAVLFLWEGKPFPLPWRWREAPDKGLPRDLTASHHALVSGDTANAFRSPLQCDKRPLASLWPFRLRSRRVLPAAAC